MTAVPEFVVRAYVDSVWVFLGSECVCEGHLGGAPGEDREPGLLDFRIRTKGHPPGTGTAAFRAMIEAIGPDRIQTLRGRWKPDPPLSDNFDAFFRLKSRGLSNAAAAQGTFTGKMAQRELEMVPSRVYIHQPWTIREEPYVHVRFNRMEWEQGGGI